MLTCGCNIPASTKVPATKKKNMALGEQGPSSDI